VLSRRPSYEICVSDAARERLGVGFLCTMIGEARGAGRIAIWRLDREQKGRADI
jgi:hypothetical protein